jgi:NAD-dependent deacetylase
MTTSEKIEKAARLIRTSAKIAILTGAGVSKESGVPTFRDAMDGLWAQYDPQQLATPQAFNENPSLVWDWYQFRRGLVNQAQPNPGHYALAEIERRKPDTWIITQNVDDLHEQAGSQNIVHLHGNIAQSKCYKNCQGMPTLIDVRSLPDADASPPKCPHCGALVRPDIVWFGEPLPHDELQKSIDLAYHCDLMLVVGTSGLVSPAAELPYHAKRNGAKILEVNPDHTALSNLADLQLEAPSGQVLPLVVEMLTS